MFVSLASREICLASSVVYENVTLRNALFSTPHAKEKPTEENTKLDSKDKKNIVHNLYLFDTNCQDFVENQE